MTAKKNNNDNLPIASKLVVDKSNFKDTLLKRIEIGSEILARAIQTMPQLDQAKVDFDQWSDYNEELLKQSFNNPQNEYKNDYATEYSVGFYLGGSSPQEKLNDFKENLEKKINVLRRLHAKVDLLKSDIEIASAVLVKTTVSTEANQNIFIVHGHDEAAKTKTARFIEKLGLNPIILHEQASGSKTVIEKIEAYSNVGFGIVLYTACDIGAKSEENPKYKSRARQNVVFEHGFLIGKIGRENVCALVKGEIETPNDISGVVYVKMDDEDAWHLKIARELRNSGYEIDMNKL
jgi:predicted nucleotide-binding protein